MNAPVLLITFNRPTHTSRVLSAIREQCPKDLFVFQDGARDDHPEDSTCCAAVRDVIAKGVDWPCKLQTFYSDKNLGCGPGPAAAISWFFEHVKQGIILEDDAVPHPDFFTYAEELLERYKEDDRIMAIGSMKLGGKRYGDGSYYFSKMNHTLCAWATWKRAWIHFDYSLKDFSTADLNHCLKAYGTCLREREYWSDRLAEIHKNGLNDSSWDQQFWMSIWRRNGRGILPNVNLCTNIGFDQLATHTRDANSPAANIESQDILPLIHPSSDNIQRKADLDFQRHYFQPWDYGWEGFKNLPFRLNKRLKRFVGHDGPWIKHK